MLLGPEMARLDSEAKTFYITGGWLENWRHIFIDGLKWDDGADTTCQAGDLKVTAGQDSS
jgi:hypothetical protein